MTGTLSLTGVQADQANRVASPNRQRDLLGSEATICQKTFFHIRSGQPTLRPKSVPKNTVCRRRTTRSRSTCRRSHTRSAFANLAGAKTRGAILAPAAAAFPSRTRRGSISEGLPSGRSNLSVRSEYRISVSTSLKLFPHWTHYRRFTPVMRQHLRSPVPANAQAEIQRREDEQGDTRLCLMGPVLGQTIIPTVSCFVSPTDAHRLYREDHGLLSGGHKPMADHRLVV